MIVDTDFTVNVYILVDIRNTYRVEMEPRQMRTRGRDEMTKLFVQDPNKEQWLYGKRRGRGLSSAVNDTDELIPLP